APIRLFNISLAPVLPSTGNTTFHANSCNTWDVDMAMQSAAAGDTLVLPAATCTWDRTLYSAAPANFTIQGQTVCTGSGNPAQNNLACVDGTILVDNVERSSGDVAMWTIWTGPGPFRMTGLTIHYLGGLSAARTTKGTFDWWIGGTDGFR